MLDTDDKDLVPVLQSLAVGKKRVLKKNSPGKEVGREDLFEVNLGFTDKAYKVHINSIQAKISVRFLPYSLLRSI